jgi:hypothetical protein
MNNHTQKDKWLYRIIISALALTLFAGVEVVIALALAGSLISGVISVFSSTTDESPAEFLVLTYLYR